MARLEGQVAVVTGAARGIGRAIAERLRDAGARVVATDIVGPQETLAEGIAFREMDVTRAADVEAAMAAVYAEHGRLSVLVNNAGITLDRRLDEMTESEWDRMMDVNLKGVFLCAKYALKYLRASGGGAIVNIGSLEGLACNPDHPAYAASKGGVHALTRSIAVDHGAEGIRCNAVVPGWINTPFNDAYFDRLADRRAGLRAVTALHPAGRLGRPKDVADAVVWLASDASGFVTGQEIVVDGGRLCRPSLPDFGGLEQKR